MEHIYLVLLPGAGRVLESGGGGRRPDPHGERGVGTVVWTSHALVKPEGPGQKGPEQETQGEWKDTY